MIQLPKPPVGIDAETAKYLRELVLFLEQALNDIDANYQKIGDPVILPQVTVADITANPGRYRAGQEGRLVLVTDASVSGALGCSFDDGLGGGPVWREISLGAEVA